MAHRHRAAIHNTAHIHSIELKPALARMLLGGFLQSVRLAVCPQRVVFVHLEVQRAQQFVHRALAIHEHVLQLVTESEDTPQTPPNCGPFHSRSVPE